MPEKCISAQSQLCNGFCESCAETVHHSLRDDGIFAPEEVPTLTEEQERLKRGIYDKMNPRRRKFVDRLGYDVWNPFQAPNDPLDIRAERTGRTLQELMRDFVRDAGEKASNAGWRKGAMECALGIIRKDEKYQGIYDFCVWYQNLLRKEGHL